MIETKVQRASFNPACAVVWPSKCLVAKWAGTMCNCWSIVKYIVLKSFELFSKRHGVHKGCKAAVIEYTCFHSSIAALYSALLHI